MSTTKKWTKTSEFSERVQFALLQFEKATGRMIYNCDCISHVRDDAVFIRIHGTIDIATLTRLSNLLNFGIWIEIDPVAHNYTDIRMFVSDWQAENCKRALRFINDTDRLSVLEKGSETILVKQDKFDLQTARLQLQENNQ
jgi:hypothetical protein